MKVIFVILGSALSASAATINFEQVSGVLPFESMSISNQFEPYYGISFRRAAGASSPWPVISCIGDPQSAFDRPGNNESDMVTPAWAASVGQFFLTDNAVVAAGIIT